MTLEKMKLLARFCEASRKQLMGLCDWYVVRESDTAFLGFKRSPTGQAKVLAVAHVDYLRSGKVHRCGRKTIVSSALDDRAGVFIAFSLLQDYGIDADILLTDQEECGRSTIKMLGVGMLKPYNWLLQLDRRGEDVVHYGYTEIADKLATVWGKNVGPGAWSDIGYLQAVSPVSAFNMGVGYFQEHTEACHLSAKVLDRQMVRLQDFYNRYKDEKFEREHAADRETSEVVVVKKVITTPYSRAATGKKVVAPGNDYWKPCLGDCGREYRDWSLYEYNGIKQWCWSCRQKQREVDNVRGQAVIQLPGTEDVEDTKHNKYGRCETCLEHRYLQQLDYPLEWWLCSDCLADLVKTAEGPVTLHDGSEVDFCYFCNEQYPVDVLKTWVYPPGYGVEGEYLLCPGCYKEESEFYSEDPDDAVTWN